MRRGTILLCVAVALAGPGYAQTKDGPTAAERPPGLPPLLWARPDKDSLRKQVRELEGLQAEGERASPKIGFGQKAKAFVSGGGVRMVDIAGLLERPDWYDGNAVMVEGVLQPKEPNRLYALTAIPGAEGSRYVDLRVGEAAKAPSLDPEALRAAGSVIPVIATGVFTVPQTGPPVLDLRKPVPDLMNQQGTPQQPLVLSAGPFAFRIGLLYEANEDYPSAIAAYSEFGKKFREHQLAPQAYYRAAILSEDKLGDTKAAAKFYTKHLWGTYVQTKSNNTYYVWRLNEEKDAYERISVKLAIGKHMDELNSKRTLYHVMDFFVRVCGGRGWAGLLLLALVTRLALYPLTKKQMLSARKMQELQPELKALQEKYKDDKQALTRKMMEMYKKRGVSPLGGCLPLLIQMPILIALYTGVRLYIYQFSLQGFLWIKDLSEPDLVLLVAYTISMIVFQKMTAKGTPSTDPQQAQMQKTMSYMMPIMFFFFFKHLPSSFILYWLGTNIVYSAQQFLINRAGSSQAKEGRVISMSAGRKAESNPGPKDEPKEEADDEEDAPEDQVEDALLLKKRRRRRRRRKPGMAAAEVKPEE